MTDQPETATTLTPAVHFSIMNARVGDTVTLEFPDGARLAAALVGRGLRNPTPALPPAYTIVNVEVAVPTEPNSTPTTETTAPTPPPGSYWTDLDGKVWDPSCQYLDRHHRLWRVTGVNGVPMVTSNQVPGIEFLLSGVADTLGPLTVIPPKEEIADEAR